MAKTWTCVAVLLLLAGSARAAELRETIVSGNWQGGAYAGADGRLSHCAVTTSYRSGIALTFAMTRNYDWRLLVSSSKWNLTKGSTYDLTFFIDGSPPRRGAATAVDTGIAYVDLPDEPALFQLFRKGNLLTVVSGGEVFRFSLQGTNAAFAELWRCVAARLDAEAAAPAPSGTRSGAPPARRASAEQRLEATKTVANMFAAGGLTEFHIVTARDLAGRAKVPDTVRDADVAWIAPGVIGTLVIEPGAQALRDLAASLTAAETRACSGKFGSGFASDDERVEIFRVFAACESDTVTFFAFYTLVPWFDGTIYRFAHFGADRRDEVEAAETSLRKAVKATLR